MNTVEEQLKLLWPNLSLYPAQIKLIKELSSNTYVISPSLIGTAGNNYAAAYVALKHFYPDFDKEDK